MSIKFFLGFSAWFIGGMLFFPAGAAAQNIPFLTPRGALERIKYDLAPISYSSAETNDPIAQIQKKLNDGDLTLEFDDTHGYLRSLMEALEIPVESQVLVFSKTALNHRLTTPKTPRALYFNDDVYLGWIPELDVIEITAVDPQKGGVFYSVKNDEKTDVPKFERIGNCLTCHANSNSLQVPGHLLRSHQVDDKGNPGSGLTRVTQDTPWEKRWGGWYVTGIHGSMTHMGNVFGTEQNKARRENPELGSNVTSLELYFDTKQYISEHSDIVALMVLEHQTNMQNLIARYNYETRLKQKTTVEQQLLETLFFVNEPELPDEVLGTAGFDEAFEFMGPEDFNGRSLRQLDLKNRVFKYRLSYLIYSKPFQELPEAAKKKLYLRIFNVLSGKDENKVFQKIPAAEKRTILEILRETIDDLPDYYKG